MENGKRQKTFLVVTIFLEYKIKEWITDSSCLCRGHLAPLFDINIHEEIAIILWSLGVISLPVQVIHHSEGWADNRNVCFIYRSLPVEKMTVILKLFNIMPDMQECIYYLPRFPVCPGLGQHLSLLRWRAGEWECPFELFWVGAKTNLSRSVIIKWYMCVRWNGG